MQYFNGCRDTRYYNGEHTSQGRGYIQSSRKWKGKNFLPADFMPHGKVGNVATIDNRNFCY